MCGVIHFLTEDTQTSDSSIEESLAGGDALAKWAWVAPESAGAASRIHTRTHSHLHTLHAVALDQEGP